MDSLRGTITTEMKAKKITGLSIAVSDSNGLLWSGGFGTANKKEDYSFTDTTISNVGSVSKLITATAVMRLVENKRIDLDEPVSTYIPEFKIKGQTPIRKTQEKSPVVGIPEKVKEDLPGYYASSAGLSEIKLSGSNLKIFTFNKWFDAYYHADNSLTLGYRLFGLFPLKLPVFDEISVSLEKIDGNPAINLRIQNILMAPSIKIEAVAIDPVWIARTGSYEAVQSEVAPHYTAFKIDLDRKSGFLCLFIKSAGEWSKYPLETIDSENARIMGIGRGLGGIIQAKRSGNGEILSFLNFELKKK